MNRTIQHILTFSFIILLCAENSFGQEDYLAEKLKPIKTNFQKINNRTNWTEIKKIELWESTEGGQATFYFFKDSIKKIVVRTFGETFQKIDEYYTFNGQVSFSYEKTYKYNRPIGWDSKKMKEMGDDELWDFNKSEIIEERSYYRNNTSVDNYLDYPCRIGVSSNLYLAIYSSFSIHLFELLDFQSI